MYIYNIYIYELYTNTLKYGHCRSCDLHPGPGGCSTAHRSSTTSGRCQAVDVTLRSDGWADVKQRSCVLDCQLIAVIEHLKLFLLIYPLS